MIKTDIYNKKWCYLWYAIQIDFVALYSYFDKFNFEKHIKLKCDVIQCKKNPILVFLSSLQYKYLNIHKSKYIEKQNYVRY